jgi:DNA-binding transcriptional MerR regulator
MNIDNNIHFSVGKTAQICGVTQKQIRHWEHKGYIPQAKRIVCGERAYREFTNVDCALICRIKEYLDEGYTLKTAAKKAAQ